MMASNLAHIYVCDVNCANQEMPERAEPFNGHIAGSRGMPFTFDNCGADRTITS